MDIYVIFPLVAAIASLSITLVAFLKKRFDPVNRSFTVLSLFIVLWSLAITFFYILPEGALLFFTAKGIYFIGGLIASSFFYFSVIFTRMKISLRLHQYLFFIPQLILFVLYYFSDTIIGGYVVDSGIRGFLYGPLRALFDIHFLLFFGGGLVILIRMRIHADFVLRRQLQYILFGSLVGVILAGVTNIILPWQGNTSLVWLGPFLVIAWPLSVAYGILKHRLFDVRIIATESFVFILWALLLVRVFISQELPETIINLGVFMATIVLGIFLVQNVNKEVTSRERAEGFARDLKKANRQLKELDQRKSEFVSLAAHQLRSPLTAMKGYSSMLLEGTFGDLSAKIKEPIKRIFESSDRLVEIIEDFLTVSRIEQNRLNYDFHIVDLKKAVRTVVDDSRQTMKKEDLVVSFDEPRDNDWNIRADIGKLNQIIGNILNNAIQYTPHGEINISLSRGREGTTAILEVMDTGVGITSDTMKKLFQKFSRANDASNTNTKGAGLGLYVARELVKAHGGKIWAESSGKDKGSTFFVEFPIAKQ